MKRATYDDVLAAPPNKVGEILDGELFLSPRPEPRHAVASSALGMALGNPFHHGSGGPGGWWILFEPELHLRRDVMVPDLASWRRERMPRLPSTAGFELAPDWECVVLSPSTARIDRTRKLRISRFSIGSMRKPPRGSARRIPSARDFSFGSFFSGTTAWL